MFNNGYRNITNLYKDITTEENNIRIATSAAHGRKQYPDADFRTPREKTTSGSRLPHKQRAEDLSDPDVCF